MQLNRSWEGPEVALYPLTSADVDERYVGWLNDALVCRFLESRFIEQTCETVADFVAACVASPTALLLGIRSRDSGWRHVGNVKLGNIDRNHGLADVGIMIGERSAWGRGIGRMAIELVASIAREELGLRKLTAGCYKENVASQAMFRRAGFVVEGERPAHLLFEGGPTDLVLMGRVLGPQGNV